MGFMGVDKKVVDGTLRLILLKGPLGGCVITSEFDAAELRAAQRRIKTLEQENEVLPGTLDGRWGPLAYDIATGAAEGLEDLLKNAPAP